MNIDIMLDKDFIGYVSIVEDGKAVNRTEDPETRRYIGKSPYYRLEGNQPDDYYHEEFIIYINQ